MVIECYTDGSCVNEGMYKGIRAGAWANKIILDSKRIFNYYGTKLNTTCTFMEIEAIKQLLLNLNHITNEYRQYNPKIIVYSDCKSIVDIINSMINNQDVKIKKRFKSDIYNIIELINLINSEISFIWIKSHVNNSSEEYNVHNNDVDILAREMARDLANKELQKI